MQTGHGHAPLRVFLAPSEYFATGDFRDRRLDDETIGDSWLVVTSVHQLVS